MILFGVFAYLAAQFALGLFLFRFIATEKDYLLAGRRLGFPVATLSIFATWFGAETCIGTSGRVYTSGLGGGRADPFGYFICLVVVGIFLSNRWWLTGHATLGDVVKEKLTPRVELISVLLMIPGSLLWAAAQMRAFGQVLAVSSGLPVGATLTIAALVVIVYTTLGGLLADAVSDTLQGGVLIIGLFILTWVVLGEFGGFQAIGDLPPERLSPFGGGEESRWARIDSWCIPIIGSLVAQELASRVVASKSGAVARGATFGGAILYLVVGSMPVLLGLAGPAVLPGLEDGEQFLPFLAQEKLPTFLYIVFAGALISAVLSTIDSALLAVGGLVSHNLAPRIVGEIEEADKLLWARRMVVLAGLISYGLAITSSGIFELVESASSFGTAGLVIVIFAILYMERVSPLAATATLLVGALFLPFSEHILQLEAPYLSSVITSFLTFLVVESLSRSTLFAKLTSASRK